MKGIGWKPHVQLHCTDEDSEPGASSESHSLALLASTGFVRCREPTQTHTVPLLEKMTVTR